MTDLLDARPIYRWPHPIEHETTLYLVRHGRTKGNVDRTLCGRLDVPLDDLGLLQAERVAQRIAREVRADALVSSPLLRARQTAGFITERTGLSASIIDDLAEWNFGDFEGKTIAEVQAVAPHVLQALENLDDDEAGWPGGEIRRVFHARVATVFGKIASDHRGQSVVVVAHGGVLGSLAAQIHGTQPNDWTVYNFQNCSLTHLTLSLEGVNVVTINDVAHLAELMPGSRSRLVSRVTPTPPEAHFAIDDGRRSNRRHRSIVRTGNVMFAPRIGTDANRIMVGHWTDPVAKTGVTALVFDRPAPAIVDVRGGAPGSRETDLLGPGMLVQSVDAIVFSGGSAFGLAAADGVMTQLQALGRGVTTPAGPVPIVPAAVIYDLAIGAPRSPTAEDGAAAFRNRVVLETAAWGHVGAGTGATTGKLGGEASRGGIGYGHVDLRNGQGVHAIVVVNSAGVVVDPETGTPVVEPTKRSDRAGLLDRLTPLHDRAATTLGLVIVDAPCDRRLLERCGVAAHDGFARAIRPCHTLYDGDIVFAASLQSGAPSGPETVRVALAAELAVERAILGAVRAT